VTAWHYPPSGGGIQFDRHATAMDGGSAGREAISE